MGAAVIPLVSAIAAAGSVVGSVVQTVQHNRQISRAKEQAARDAELERAFQASKAKQQRSEVYRRAAANIDAGRVLAAASGAIGGSSQLILESGYLADANADLASISSNQARGLLTAESRLGSQTAQLNGMTANPFVSALQGVLQGVSTHVTLRDSLTAMTNPGGDNPGASPLFTDLRVVPNQ